MDSAYCVMKTNDSRPVPALLVSLYSFLTGLAWLAVAESEISSFFVFIVNLSLVLMGHGIPISPTSCEPAHLLFERLYVQSSVT